MISGKKEGGGDLRRYALLSVGAAVATMALKAAAWKMTGSVGLLSDAIESGVNLAGALMALWMLSLAAMPADEKHPHGHGKAEYFSSGFEGFLILAAALCIMWTAGERLMHPAPLEELGLGLGISALASLVNGAVALVLMSAGKKAGSIVLEADAHHLFSDVWTSVGVIGGLALAWATGWAWLDPAVALAVAANILWTGWNLVRRSAAGLMDSALPPEEAQKVWAALDRFRSAEVDFHEVATRRSGQRAFIGMHMLVPGDWSVARAHDLCESVEEALKKEFAQASVSVHVEPKGDPRSEKTDWDEA